MPSIDAYLRPTDNQPVEKFTDLTIKDAKPCGGGTLVGLKSWLIGNDSAAFFFLQRFAKGCE